MDHYKKSFVTKKWPDGYPECFTYVKSFIFSFRNWYIIIKICMKISLLFIVNPVFACYCFIVKRLNMDLCSVAFPDALVIKWLSLNLNFWQVHVDIKFQTNSLKIKIFCNQLIFEAIAKLFFKDILNKRSRIPIILVFAFFYFLFSSWIFKAVTIKLSKQLQWIYNIQKF